MGSVSAAMTTNSEIPRFSVFVAAQQNFAQLKRHSGSLAQRLCFWERGWHRAPSLAPFRSCL